jgi:F0F1-type ATP synthase membrane subunit c/vacuolar-type H+-ATPase subunit K
MAAAIIAGIGAATGLAQGIFGASSASRQNRKLKPSTKHKSSNKRRLLKD